MLDGLIEYVKANPKRAALGGAAALVCIFSLWSLFSGGSSNLDHPDGYTLVCQNPSCRHEFKMSLSQAAEYRAKHAGEPIPCPKCGQTNVVQAGSRPRPVAPAR